MITVHHLDHSRSQRIVWLLEELNVPYEIKYYKRLPSMRAPPELRQVHPLGKAPVITDRGKTIAESGAIIEYLLEHYGAGRLQPTDKDERERFRFFMHFAEGTVMPQLVMKLVFSLISKPPVPFFIRPVAKILEKGINAKVLKPQLKNTFDFLENELQTRDWLAGKEFSAADVQMSFPVEMGEQRVGFENRPRLKAYLERLHARPAFQRAKAKAV